MLFPVLFEGIYFINCQAVRPTDGEIVGHASIGGPVSQLLAVLSANFHRIGVKVVSWLWDEQKFLALATVAYDRLAA